MKSAGAMNLIHFSRSKNSDEIRRFIRENLPGREVWILGDHRSLYGIVWGGFMRVFSPTTGYWPGTQNSRQIPAASKGCNINNNIRTINSSSLELCLYNNANSWQPPLSDSRARLDLL
jgi:hypothetical protein